MTHRSSEFHVFFPFAKTFWSCELRSSALLFLVSLLHLRLSLEQDSEISEPRHIRGRWFLLCRVQTWISCLELAMGDELLLLPPAALEPG